MTCGIYSITNKNTRKMYIGQSINIENRFKQHKYGHDSHSKSGIDYEIKTIGKDNFVFDVLLECNEDELDENEMNFIEKYNTFYNGYNRTKGGDKLNNPTKYWSNAKKIERGVKYSKKNSTTGIYRVSKCGTSFQYLYKENGKRKGLSCVDLERLKEKVIAKGLPWLIVNVELANKTMDDNKKEVMAKKSFNTGFYNVRKYRGFYVYFYSYKGVKRKFQSVDISILEKKVKENGFPWGLIDEDKAKACGLV